MVIVTGLIVGGLQITVLNVHSHPQAGDLWTVSFETTGLATLKIIPNDQNSIDDLEFISLKCNGKTRTPKILKNDVITYYRWFCNGKAEIIHLVNVARPHILKFQFGNKTAYAYNSPPIHLKISASSNTGLVGYWKMDDDDANATVTDQTGVNDGTFSDANGTATTAYHHTAGKVGTGALSFDGVDDYVDMGNASGFALTGSSTVLVWVKADTAAGNAKWPGVIDKTNWSIRFQQNSSNIYAKAVIGGVKIGPEVTLTLNTWYLIGLTNDLTNMTFYVNGVDEGSIASGGGYDTHTDSLVIGDHSASSYPFDGLIDEVRIYNRALSATEIARSYRDGLARIRIATPNPHDWSSDLVGFWTFNGKDIQGLNATATDISGQGNNGTITGGVFGVAGIVGQALSFDGVSDYVDLGNSQSLYPSELTAELWIYTEGAQPKGSASPLFATSDAWMFLSDGTGNNIAPRLSTTPTGAFYPTPTWVTLPFGQWNHLLFTWKRPTLNFYLNGELVATGTRDEPIGTTPATVKLGQQANDATSFRGLIDEVRVYNRALLADEIEEHYSLSRRNLGI